MITIKMPELGEEIEKATVSCIYFKVGDEIKEDDDILELTTDKATFNVPASASGVLTKILVKEGQEVMVGETLVIVE